MITFSTLSGLSFDGLVHYTSRSKPNTDHGAECVDCSFESLMISPGVFSA